MKQLKEFINEHRINESKIDFEQLKSDALDMFRDWLDIDDNPRSSRYSTYNQLEAFIDDRYDFEEEIIDNLVDEYDWDEDLLYNKSTFDAVVQTLRDAASEAID